MKLFLRGIDLLSLIALTCAGLILVYAVSHILLETVLRSLFDTSTHVLDEFIGFAVLSITFLSLSWTLRGREHDPSEPLDREVACISKALAQCNGRVYRHRFGCLFLHVLVAQPGQELEAWRRERKCCRSPAMDSRYNRICRRMSAGFATCYHDRSTLYANSIRGLIMDPVTTALAVFALMLAVLASGMWVFLALATAAALSLFSFMGFSPERIGAIASRIMVRSASSWELAAVPMFIWMGEIMFRTDISERLYKGLSPLVAKVPGGLLHTVVLGSTLFAAVSGSSAATTATVGRITTNELQSRGYARSLSLGSLAGAGSLGLLIPPSIVLIIYGVLAEVSIAKLFIAGVMPGLMIASFYAFYPCGALLHVTGTRAQR